MKVVTYYFLINYPIRYNNQDLKMNNIRVEGENFMYSFVLPAKKLWDMSEVEAHFCYEQAGGRKFFFKRRQFPNLKVLQPEAAKTVIDHTTESLRNQLAISQSGISKYIMRYNCLIISYPFACFLHDPFIDNLSNFIKNPLTFQQKVNLMLKIARGVEDLHDKNICIKTLRPSAIILTSAEDQEYSIVFSELRNIESLDQKKKLKTAEIKQSNFYMAPELIDKKEPSLSCDIWSLGMVFFEIFFNKRLNMVKLEQDGLIEYPEEASKWTCNFLEKMISIESRNRYNIKDIIRFLKNVNLCSKLSKNCSL